MTPVIGGVIVGFMAKYGSPKIKGHGIPEAMEAVLANRSRIEPRVAILKPIPAAIAIGTGGPFGAEGPIIQTGGAIGIVGCLGRQGIMAARLRRLDEEHVRELGWAVGSQDGVQPLNRNPPVRC